MTIQLTQEQITTLRECLLLALKSPSVNLDGARLIVTLDVQISAQLAKASEESSAEPK